MLARQLCMLMTAALLCSTAIARDPRPGEPGYVDITPPPRTMLQGSAHFGSSPFNPPEGTDATFVVDTGPGLDTGCTFRSGGPLRFEILVDRAFASAAEIQKLKENGLISDKAVVRMPAYDIDFDSYVPGYSPERDRVYFNGHAVPEEFLTGGNGIWKLNTFQVPIEWVNFRETGVADPGSNEVRIDIDTANTEEAWCTAIDWAALSIHAARPVVLAHGILSDNTAWAPVWVPSLQAAGVAVSQDINPSMGNLDSIQNNATKIATAVERAKERWGVEKVNLVTHSKGGLDSRHYVEGSDSVETLVQLGTPNAGSPLADLAQGVVLGVGGIGGSIIVNALAGPAGIQLTTPYMALYNRNHGYNPEVSYNALAGEYDAQCFFCLDAALNAIVGPGDTIVPVESVHALPYTRNFLFASSGSNKDATHTQLEKSLAVYNQMSSLVTTAPQQKAAAALSPDSAHSETAVGTISAGQLQSRTVVVDESPAMISMFYPAGELGLTLISPSGRRIDPVVAGVDGDIDFAGGEIPGGMQAVYSVQNAEPGTWTAEVVAISGNEVDYAINAWSRNPRLTLGGGFARQSIALGEDLVLQATLREQGIPVLGASAYALVAAPGGGLTAITLRDDGSNGDQTPSDGIYSATHPAVPQAGLHRVLFVAEGVNVSGQRFSRETFSLATVSHGQARIIAFRDAANDTNGNGYYDELVVQADVRVDVGGQYHVLAVLTDTAGHAHQASVRQTLTAGDNTIPLVFDGKDIYRNRTNGPFILSTIRLAQENDMDLLPTADLEESYATGPYAYVAFEHERIQLIGTGLAMGVDGNGNDLYDSLDIAVDVELAQAGYYQWSAQLSDRTGTTLGFYSGAAYLNAGTEMFVFSFAGEPIGKNGEDGPYYVTDLLAFGGNASLVAEQVFKAEPFQAIQFEGYASDNTPPELQLSADPSQLWPPNHRMVPVNVNIVVQDDQDPQPTVTLVSVASNEADNGLGDGDLGDDIQEASIGTDDRQLALRAERSGTGTGRVYTLTYEARDAAGNVSTATVTVAVPLSRR